MRIQCICPVCGTTFERWRSKATRQFCSRSCGNQGRRRENVRDRFWAKVDHHGPIPPHRLDLGPCWIWTASRTIHGYGKFFYQDRLRGAHIVAYILSAGHEPPPDAPCILHACDGGNIGCVRPSHLFAGTQQDNMTDMILKGRACLGPGRALAKLSYALADEIRARYATGRESHETLAANYGVSRTAISQVLNRLTWNQP
jgi:hypothetical protein